MHAAMGTKDQDIEMLMRKLRERFERYPIPEFLLLQRLAALEHSAVISGREQQSFCRCSNKEGNMHDLAKRKSIVCEQHY